MIFGLDGVEIGLLIVFLCLFGGILSGFPVAFAIGGAAVISFGIIAALDSSGLLMHQAIDKSSAEFGALIGQGIKADTVSLFRFPNLPRIEVPIFANGWEVALDRNVSFIVNRINERVLAGQSIETLLAVLMFVLMGITLERSKIANDLLTTMARVFGPLPGGLAVSVVVVGAFLAGLAVNSVLPEGKVKEQVIFVGGALFIPIFFIHLGLLLDLGSLADSISNIEFTALMLTGALGCKALAAVIAGRWFHYSPNQILLMWSLAMPKVAATLATAFIGFQAGLLDNTVLNLSLIHI